MIKLLIYLDSNTQNITQFICISKMDKAMLLHTNDKHINACLCLCATTFHSFHKEMARSLEFIRHAKENADVIMLVNVLGTYLL